MLVESGNSQVYRAFMLARVFFLRRAPGRPKKNRSKKNDFTVEARASDPTMLKRKGTSLRCGICQQYGHNSRTCKKKQKVCNLLEFW